MIGTAFAFSSVLAHRVFTLDVRGQMGEFQFNTIDTWDVGHHHGHSAFRLLRLVYEIEQDYRTVRDQMRKVPWGQADYLRLSGRAHYLTIEMFRVSSASVMMFQGMMEALINDSLEREVRLATINKKGSFSEKWCGGLDEVGGDRTPFDAYFTDVYRKFRKPMVHPEKVKMKGFDDLSFKVLLDGYRNGWLAFEALYDGLGHPHDPDSWKTMCAAHEVLSEVVEAP